MKMLFQWVIISLFASSLAYAEKSKPQVENDVKAYSWDFLEDSFYSGVAWYFVPVATELAINVLEQKILPSMPRGGSVANLKQRISDYLKEALVKSHKKNVQLATNQHLTDYYSARIESLIFKSLSDEHERFKTSEIQEDLLRRSLRTNAYLSKQAAKARKTYMRLLTIADSTLGAARVALAAGHEDEAAAQIAFLAMALLHVHPEMKAADIATTVNALFSRQVHFAHPAQFRKLVMDRLHELDPLKSEFSLFNFNYCRHLNDWNIGEKIDCDAVYGNKALDEAAHLLEDPQGATDSMLSKLLTSLSKDQVRSFVFYTGLLAPSTAVYFVSKNAGAHGIGKIAQVVTQHFAKIVGLATTKAEIERHASDTRKAIESWGFQEPKEIKAKVHEIKNHNEMTDFANSFLGHLQKEAGKLLAEQPNFARSNIQRTLEVLTIHFVDAYKMRQQGQLDEAAMIIAGAAVHSLREIVEASADEIVIRAAIIAFSPIDSEAMLAKTRELILKLDPAAGSRSEIRNLYEELLMAWSSGQVRYASSSPIHFATMQDELIETKHQAEAQVCELEDEPLVGQSPIRASVTDWIFERLPSKNTIVVATKHMAPFGYSALSSIVEIALIKKYFDVKEATNIQKFFKHFTFAIMDFGLRTVGEPAIVHMQTVLKSAIDSAAGLLRREDAKIQDNLASKVDELQRKLSIEAQTSRSYKMEFEPTLMSLLSFASEAGLNGKDLSASAMAVGLGAYWLRALHPDFGAGDIVMDAISHSRLKQLQVLLESEGKTIDYCANIFASLASIDANFEEVAIKSRYVEMMRKWGFASCSLENADAAQDVVNLFAQYGDIGAGILGFSLQAGLKTLCDTQGIVVRSLCGFGANVVEFAATDPLRKKIYAGITQWMLNVVAFEQGAEKELADQANSQLTEYFRMQKFHFGKPELDVRTGIMMLVSSVFGLIVDGNAQLAIGEVNQAEHYYALAFSRILALYPEIDGEDAYLANILDLLSKGHEFSENFAENVKRETINLLKEMAPKYLLSAGEEAKLLVLIQRFARE